MMNVLFSANDIVYPGLELAIYTLLTHNKNVNIYVFTMDIIVGHDGVETRYCELTADQKNKLRMIVLYLDPNSEICFIDVTKIYVKEIAGSVNDGSPFTPFASLRLLSDIVLTDVDDILYLDCDVAIQSSIESMYRDCKFGADDCYGSYAYDAYDGFGEFVSGVFFMKLNKFREKGYLAKARELYKKNLYRFPDQMALRDSIKDIGRLQETYGYMDPIEECGYTPAILHFTNKLNPKVYSRKAEESEMKSKVFYNRYPQFKYVQEGCDLIDTINMKR